ncbi:hypothetical protein SLEP1_g874 [Rubroshorea leprosula]|uniref:Uncharacterized protein n=1 Tax=Rubroshorea leprosula TaxID=152421 RepID=A0AAV5HGN8_9ROSI|nr:hypothetical protein SLEP1_g874 [Rubroshorea leprosula]
MADALVSAIIEQLLTITTDVVQKRVRLLTNVKNEVQKLRCNLMAIHAVLADAEEKQMTNRSIQVWLDQLKEAAYDIEDVLDEWNAQLLKSCTDEDGKTSTLKAKVWSCLTSCFHPGKLVRCNEIASRIKEINGRLDEIAKQKANYNLEERYDCNLVIKPDMEQQPLRETTSFVDVSEIFGRDAVKDDIISSLLCKSGEEGSELKTISVVGMGGVGKTALAQLVVNDGEVKKHFAERIWVCASDIFYEKRVAKEIVKRLEGLKENISDPISMEELLGRICSSIEGKKFFLVLDDVWADNWKEWERLIHTFKKGASGSRILITTRKETVANMMKYSHVFRLEKLSDEYCWMILCSLAFTGTNEKERENLEEIGKKISVKCKGLPLIAKTLGSLLRSKGRKDDWEEILNIYPKDSPLWRSHIIYYWMALGCLESKSNKDMEAIGSDYFDFLASRSFFQDSAFDSNGSIYVCKLHDLVHDFALFLASNEIVIKELNSANSKIDLEADSTKNLNSNIDVSVRKTRQLAVVLAKGVSFPTSIQGAEKLRSLFAFSGEDTVTEEALRIFFNRAKALRVLDVTWPDTYNGHFKGSIIPSEIGRMIHLRHLNFSEFRKVKRLPESICEIPFLQYLDLNECSGLEKLPDGIENLINLRYLRTINCDSLTSYPKGVGILTQLRNLYGLIVRADRNDPKEFSLGDLENLDQLLGLWMVLKGNSLDSREASRAKLEKKTRLVDFNLDSKEELDREEVIAALNPPPKAKLVEFELHENWWPVYRD